MTTTADCVTVRSCRPRTESELQALKASTITKADLYEIVRRASPQTAVSTVIAMQLFGHRTEHEGAPERVLDALELESGRRPVEAPALVCSSFGTMGYTCGGTDGKSIAVVHTSGDDPGACYVVRKGIGWFYRTHLEGAGSVLGFPVSAEYATADRGRMGCRSDFEGGFIEWLAQPDAVSVYRYSHRGDRKILGHKL